MKIALAGFAQDALVVKGVWGGLYDLDLKEGKGQPRKGSGRGPPRREGSEEGHVSGHRNHVFCRCLHLTIESQKDVI